MRAFQQEPGSAKYTSLESLETIPGNVLVVVAHPDDEVFCSGLLIQLIERNATVKILCLTKGEGGPTGDTPRNQLGEKREQEMRKSCEILGVDSIEFLGHIDPIAGRYRTFAPDVSVADLAAQISPFLEGVDLVLCHGSSGEYWHPAHLLVHSAVKGLMSDSPAAWFTFLAHNPDHPIQRLVNRDDAAFLTIDTSEQSEQRQRALQCHESQLSLFGKFAGGDYRDFIRKTSIESYGCPTGTSLLEEEPQDSGSVDPG